MQTSLPKRDVIIINVAPRMTCRRLKSGAFLPTREKHTLTICIYYFLPHSYIPLAHISRSLAMAAERREIIETDDSGNITATYVQTAWSKASLGRVDVIYPRETKAVWQRVLDVFLPAGYPHSVTSDYLE